MGAKECRRNGIWMSHKLESAKWLAERGWGRAGLADTTDRPTTINLINYGDAATQAAPPIQTTQIFTDDKLASAENDSGKDASRDDDGDLPMMPVAPPLPIFEEEEDPIR